MQRTSVKFRGDALDCSSPAQLTPVLPSRMTLSNGVPDSSGMADRRLIARNDSSFGEESTLLVDYPKCHELQPRALASSTT